MFKLDMEAIRRSADAAWLTANLANPANSPPEISQCTPKLATLAGLAISHDVSHESAELLTARVIAAAMRACDAHGDGPEAREEMRQDVLNTPAHLRADLLEHFQQTYGAKP